MFTSSTTFGFSYVFDFAGGLRAWNLIPKHVAPRWGRPQFSVVGAAALSKIVGGPAWAGAMQWKKLWADRLEAETTELFFFRVGAGEGLFKGIRRGARYESQGAGCRLRVAGCGLRVADSDDRLRRQPALD